MSTVAPVRPIAVMTSPSPSPSPSSSSLSGPSAVSTSLDLLRMEDDASSLSASTRSPQRSACASGASSPPLPGETLPALGTSLIRSTQQVVRHVQMTCSEMVFVMEEGSSEVVGTRLTESETSLVSLVGSYSNGDVIRGALNRSTRDQVVSVASSSDGLTFLVPVLLEAVIRRQALVVHVEAFQLNDQLGLERAPWKGLEWVKESGAGLLFSSTPQEAHDMAVAAHLIARRTGMPVIHFYDGLMSREVYEFNQVITIESGASWWQGVEEAALSPLSWSQGVSWALELINRSWQRTYRTMERSGANQATDVLVTWPNSTLLARVPPSWGVVLVRVYRPFPGDTLRHILPPTTRTVWVEPSSLWRDVASALHQWTPTQRPLVRLWSAQDMTEEWSSPSLAMVELWNVPEYWTVPLEEGEKKTIVSESERDAQRVTQWVEAFPAWNGHAVLIRKNCYRPQSSEKWLVPIPSQSTLSLSAEAQVRVVVCASETLQDTELLRTLGPESQVIVISSTWDENSNSWPRVAIHPAVRQQIRDKQLTVSFVSSYGQALEQVKAWPSSSPAPLQAVEAWLVDVEKEFGEDSQGDEPSEEALATMKQASESLAQLGSLQTSTLFRTHLAPRGTPETEEATFSWRFLFPEAYQQEKRLKPHARDSHGLHQVQVTQWLRLTPESYDRNVFHIEMDISQTNLRYEIGDALGVYGHNSAESVQQFLREYDATVQPQQWVALPLPDQSDALQLRSLEQILIQDVDLFGRPTKRFYAQLAPYATDSAQASLLQELGEGNAEESFRQRTEESMTIAEILLEFTSARPSWAELVRMIGPIKPRHYSIASSMNMHPDSVHLLVVDHTWVTPQGVLRRGQCTRYLQGLRKGDTVTVSVKPSIMKLPASHSTPIVMAGLGTGMAPFRAFLQERLYQQQVNQVEIGEMVLYFGSRSSREEYLYGEELEAYLAMGALTHMGLAFSRDQPHKIYIQHKIREDGALLWRLLHAQRGTFYLCGPTWPAADVQDAITANLVQEGSWSTQRAIDEVMAMKAAERYILEVY